MLVGSSGMPIAIFDGAARSKSSTSCAIQVFGGPRDSSYARLEPGSSRARAVTAQLVSPSPESTLRTAQIVTKSLCDSGKSSCARDALRVIVVHMDVVAILIGIAMFAILLLMIEGIDRI